MNRPAPIDPAAYVNAALRLAVRAAADRPHVADEVQSEAMVLLVEAARAHDPARGRFTTYLYARLRGYAKGARFRAAGEADDGPRWRDVPDRDRDPADGPDRPEVLRLRAAVGRLRGDHHRYVTARWGLDGRPPAGVVDLARRFGWSGQRCGRIEREALERLRSIMARPGELRPLGRPRKEAS